MAKKKKSKEILEEGQEPKPKVAKKRTWAFVAYPESLPSDWKDILKQSGLKAAVSPLHDKDNDPDEAEKKAHYHIILVYSGPMSLEAVARFTNGRLGQTKPIALESVRGYYRYFTHKDNPEKFQYSEAEIETFGGFDINDFVELSGSEIQRIKQALHNLIRELDIVEYSDFVDVVMDNGTPDEFFVATTNTVHFNAYLKSRYHKKRLGNQLPRERPEDY